MKTHLLFNVLKGKAIVAFFVVMLGIGCTEVGKAIPDFNQGDTPPPTSSKKIKIGLLLDTSNSMDGLIDQAKSQLWKIVNELAKAKCEGENPELLIALYEYGNDRLTASEGYIRMVTPLTNDLDKISEDLFSLTTNGGSEFCGKVIQTATNQLDWGKDNEDLKLIFIAGNEPFTQGSVHYKEACNKAGKLHITVNTIFCGQFNEGIRTSWKNGADITNGQYMSIDQNSKTVYIPSPYDDDITSLNSKLNDTYISYGYYGNQKKLNQVAQDNNAAVYGKGNSVSRIISKNSHFYSNSSWDLVDASKDSKFDINKIDNRYLPEKMQKMSDIEKNKYIQQNKAERSAINKKINALNVKRMEYVNEKKKEMGEDENSSLDQAMINAIHKQAKSKNFSFSK